jgi:hypothetical protein
MVICLDKQWLTSYSKYAVINNHTKAVTGKYVTRGAGKGWLRMSVAALNPEPDPDNAGGGMFS